VISRKANFTGARSACAQLLQEDLTENFTRLLIKICDSKAASISDGYIHLMEALAK